MKEILRKIELVVVVCGFALMPLISLVFVPTTLAVDADETIARQAEGATNADSKTNADDLYQNKGTAEPILPGSSSGGGDGNASGGGGGGDDNCVSTSLLFGGKYCDDGSGSGIKDVLGIAIDVLTFGVGTAAVLGVVISGIQYLTAGDNAGQMQKAKARILHIVIGLAVYAIFWGVLKFLLPGGLSGDGS